MSGYKSSKMRYDCKTSGCAMDRKTSWDDLISNLPCTPTDIDGLVEIDRNFLFLEEKGNSGSWDLSSGQGLALSRLSQIPNILVVFFCRTGSSVKAMWLPHETSPRLVSWEEFCIDLRSWSLWARDSDNYGTVWEHGGTPKSKKFTTRLGEPT